MGSWTDGGKGHDEARSALGGRVRSRELPSSGAALMFLISCATVALLVEQQLQLSDGLRVVVGLVVVARLGGAVDSRTQL